MSRSSMSSTEDTPDRDTPRQPTAVGEKRGEARGSALFYYQTATRTTVKPVDVGIGCRAACGESARLLAQVHPAKILNSLHCIVHSHPEPWKMPHPLQRIAAARSAARPVSQEGSAPARPVVPATRRGHRP